MSYAKTAVTDRLQRKIAQIRGKLEGITGDLNHRYTGHRFEDCLTAVGADAERAYWESRLQELESVLMNYRFPSSSNDFRNEVSIEDVVRLQRLQDGKEMSFRITDKVDLFEGEKCVTPKSPLGVEVLGRKPGDIVNVITPMGKFKYKLVSLERN